MNRVAGHMLAIERVRSPSRAGVLLALAAAIALAACGGGEPAAPAATPATPATEPAAPGATPAPAPAPVEAAPAVEALSVDELLKRARQSLTDERLVSPMGDNAVEYYLQVLAQEPSNPQATQALVDVFPLAAGIAERALAQRQVDEAARVIGLLDRVDPRSYTVATLRTKLTTAQAQADREAQQAAAAATAQQQAAAAAQQQQQAAAAAAQQQAAAPAAPPASPPPAPTPAPVPAPVEAPAAPPVAATPAPAPSGETRDARPLRQVPPQFPIDAARKRQEGWVELEFTVAADGSVRDVSVARAQPTRVFDREAVRAMQQWTFEPALRNGQPVESRGRRRINFQL
jgi:protein TonB